MSNVLFDALFANHIGSEAPFFILPEGDDWSYQRFLETAAQYAHELEALGVGVGDRLAVQVQKSPEALATYAACLQAGVIFLPLNTAYTAHEMAYFIENSEQTGVVRRQSRNRFAPRGAGSSGAIAGFEWRWQRLYKLGDATSQKLPTPRPQWR